MERFWNKVNKSENGCWGWKAGKTDRGYGTFRFNGQTWRAHRFSYLLTKGELIEGLVIDHLCRNIICVNPDHLEQVTQLENSRRGIQREVMLSRTHCKNGHEYTDKVNKKGHRVCDICAKAKWKRAYAKRRLRK
jgi:hypothetical protein